MQLEISHLESFLLVSHTPWRREEEMGILLFERRNTMQKCSKKIVHRVALITSLLWASSTFSSCLQTVAACNNAPGNIPANAECSNYYILTGGSANTTITYCTQCNTCIAGMNDCIKGDLGCNECNISTGSTTYHGVACTGPTGACASGNTNYSCNS